MAAFQVQSTGDAYGFEQPAVVGDQQQGAVVGVEGGFELLDGLQVEVVDTDGEHVLVEPGELDEIAPGRSQALEITDFVDLDEVDPMFFDKTYHLGPRGKASTRSTASCSKHWRTRARPGSPRS